MLHNGQTAAARTLLTATFTTILERGVLSLAHYLTRDGLDLLAETPEGQKMQSLVHEHDIALVTVEPLSSAPLTSAETDVLRLLKARRTRQEIADELFLSIHTVKSHLTSAYRKLGASTRAEALVKAEQLDL